MSTCMIYERSLASVRNVKNLWRMFCVLSTICAWCNDGVFVQPIPDTGNLSTREYFTDLMEVYGVPCMIIRNYR